MPGQVVVVTGSSAGIGRATAVEFAKHGWRVALLARGTDGLEGAREEVEIAGGQALVVPVDVADQAQVEAAAERVEREWGPIDVWINNAMATIFCDFVHILPEDFKRATEVTYLGTVWSTLAALKRMKPRNRGANQNPVLRGHEGEIPSRYSPMTLPSQTNIFASLLSALYQTLPRNFRVSRQILNPLF